MLPLPDGVRLSPPVVVEEKGPPPVVAGVASAERERGLLEVAEVRVEVVEREEDGIVAEILLEPRDGPVREGR